ncbi:hypothetical protein CEUSTIGMA_g6963.t1 [Chlamydomonas eustigma]|uniref:Ubiquinol oxidase n=1 Tax=Chlamydomonas eustigma TaxID=1157962 RepID=A0A250X9G6_9CHLO|nr:hypothetical protein CEUSTIGMA_g6963.t1 [Chlamydomonas eustigma]|eukprot:GAX79522.1 hypothetical protein CEUSTIGMA_g6963.t1 [Chlamydomonas eustigma]
MAHINLLRTIGFSVVRADAPQICSYLSTVANPFSASGSLSVLRSMSPPSGSYELAHGFAIRGYSAEKPPVSTAAPDLPGGIQMHQGLRKGFALTNAAKEWSFDLSYSPEYAESIKPQHKPPKAIHERIAYYAIQTVRWCFDKATGYSHHKPQTEEQWLRRVIFLETVAGVPGMCAGMLRHLMSLRTMNKDHGWIHTLLEEAENERMHLLTFLEIRKPGLLFRGMVILAQGIFFNLYFIAYIISPKLCHSLVGYLEEEAVRTYTHMLNDIEKGYVWKDRLAPAIGINYWKLAPEATMRDLILAVRADEACHSKVNHVFSELKPHEDNPFVAGDDTVTKH